MAGDMKNSSILEKTAAQYLRKYFVGHEILYNTRPSWLVSNTGHRMELDFYIPGLFLAIEVQGKQHAEFSQLFHKDYADFLSQVERDKKKESLCKARGIKLVHIYNKADLASLIESREMPEAYKLLVEHRRVVASIYIAESVYRLEKYYGTEGRPTHVLHRKRQQKFAEGIPKLQAKIIKALGDYINMEQMTMDDINTGSDRLKKYNNRAYRIDHFKVGGWLEAMLKRLEPQMCSVQAMQDLLKSMQAIEPRTLTRKQQTCPQSY